MAKSIILALTDQTVSGSHYSSSMRKDWLFVYLLISFKVTVVFMYIMVLYFKKDFIIFIMVYMLCYCSF